MGVLWCACTAPLWAAMLWPAVDPCQPEKVDCVVTEVFANGGKTPTGSLTVVLTPMPSADLPKGLTRLQGEWRGGPTLSVCIKAVDSGWGRVPLHVQIHHELQSPNPGGGFVTNGITCQMPMETSNDFDMEVPKLGSFGGRYELAFHRRGSLWRRLGLPWQSLGW